MLSFKPSFSLFSFTFIKRLFSSSSLSAITLVSSAHRRLLMFLLAILCFIQPSILHEAGKVVWYSHLFQNFPRFIVIHTVIDVFLELSCFFHDPTDVGNLISGSSAFSKTSLNIWKFTVHVLLKPGLENFQHYFTSVWDECNCEVV